jgi:hypothetical protein
MRKLGLDKYLLLVHARNGRDVENNPRKFDELSDADLTSSDKLPHIISFTCSILTVKGRASSKPGNRPQSNNRSVPLHERNLTGWSTFQVTGGWTNIGTAR